MIEDTVNQATLTANIYKQQWQSALHDVVEQLKSTKIVHVKCNHQKTKWIQFEYYKQGPCGESNRCFDSEYQCESCNARPMRSIDTYNFTDEEYDFVRKAIDSVMTTPNQIIRGCLGWR